MATQPRVRMAHEYTPAEFDSVVAMIRADVSLREDIEAITGQSLDGKSPRQLFDLFLTLQRATEVQAVVVNYGRARQALRQTRQELTGDAGGLPDGTARFIEGLEAKVENERAKRIKAEEALKQLAEQRRNLVSLPAGDSRKAV